MPKYNTGTVLLYFGTHAYLFSSDKGSCYVFSTRNNCCEFLASNGVIIQSVTQLFLKSPVCGASLTHLHGVLRINNCPPISTNNVRKYPSFIKIFVIFFPFLVHKKLLVSITKKCPHLKIPECKNNGGIKSI